MRRSVLTTTVSLLALLPILLILFLARFQIQTTEHLEASRESMVRSFAIMSSVKSLSGLLKDAERGQRGFLLTGDPAYLAPYQQGIDDIARTQAQLAGLVEGRQQLDALRKLIAVKLRELRETVDLTKQGKTAAALEIVRSNLGETTMAAITTAVSELVGREQAVLQQNIDRSAAVERTARLAMLSGSALAGTLFAVASLILFRAYAANREARGILEATLNSVREGVGAFDSQHRLIAFNQLFQEIVGIPTEWAKRQPSLEEFRDFATEPCQWVAEELPDLDKRARQTGRPLTIERKCDDGRILELYHHPRVEGGSVTSISDVTEARHTELLFRQAQKMESLGHLTGGVAHDFNNLLTIVLGNVEALRRLVGDKPAAVTLIDRALAGVDRGAKLTQQLLSFARRQPLEPQVTNLGEVLPLIVELLNKTIGERVEISAIGAGGLWNAFVDVTQFESAVLNLALNARDAMPDGGKLTIELGNAALDAAYAARHDGVKAGQYVMVAVTDTGTGMTPEVIARAFDPFFSTKEEGKGTGLGLSQVYGFAKQSGGHVKIYSEVGHGTTIRLYLPRHAGSARANFDGPAPGDLSGNETILVVEDDPEVSATVVAMLRDLGYNVIEAANGAAALSILERPGRIDMLFTDVVMPGAVTSRALATSAEELRPGIKILFTSGYTENAIIHNGRLDEGVQLISKPYRREQLAVKIRLILKGS